MNTDEEFRMSTIKIEKFVESRLLYWHITRLYRNIFEIETNTPEHIKGHLSNLKYNGRKVFEIESNNAEDINMSESISNIESW